MNRTAYFSLVAAQCSLAVGLIICILLAPHIIPAEGGLSYFGIDHLTIPFFTIGLSLASFFTIRASYQLKSSKRKVQLNPLVIRALGVMLFLTMLSTYPYRINVYFGDLHLVIACSLFLYLVYISYWLLTRLGSTTLEWLLFGVQAVSLLLAPPSWDGYIHLLFTAQTASLLAFMVLFLTSTRKLVRDF